MFRTHLATLLIPAALAVAPAPALAAHAMHAAHAAHSDSSAANSVLDFTVRTASGDAKALADFRGKVLLVVNTASHCGFTPQYDALEKLYLRYHERGFEILAFPANNYFHEEPGTDAEIQTFCRLKYDVTFPVFAKISVKGRDIAPLYAYLTKRSPFPGTIGWNFNKFVIAPDGRVLARFGARTDPMGVKLTQAIEAALPPK